MILVLCPNLAVDVTSSVGQLVPGGIHRAGSTVRQAGGKGVNVARALRALGEAPLVLGLAGGRRGEEIAERLGAEKIASALVPIAGESRTCTILLEGDGRATVVNENGPDIEPREVEAFVDRFEAYLPKARAVAFMGSLPPGLPSDRFARLVERARERDIFRLVDTSGDALARGLESLPSMVKPNLDEAEKLFGRGLDSELARWDALAALRDRGAEVAMVTLGKDGALVDAPSLKGRFWTPPSTDLRLGNPTGAGDSLAAGLLAGTVRGYPLAEAVKLGVAAAVASLAEGYGRFRARDLRPEAVRFEPASGR